VSAVATPGFGSALAVQARVVVSLMLREMRIHTKHSRLSYLLELLEPILQLTMMLGVFSAIGRRPDSHQQFLFLGTGMIRTSPSSTSRPAPWARCAAPRWPATALVKPLDLLLARAFLETLQLAIVAIILFGFIYYVIGVRDAGRSCRSTPSRPSPQRR